MFSQHLPQERSPYHFFLPLSMQASEQLSDLQDIIQQGNYGNEQKDQWTYNWGSSNYSSKKAYKEIVGSQQASPLFNWLWSASNLGKHKFSSGFSSGIDSTQEIS